MNHNFITNNGTHINLNKRLQNLIEASKELKFLVGFFYFSGWQEVYQKLKENEAVSIKILVGLQVDKYLGHIVEHGIQDNNLSQAEYFTRFMKSMGAAVNNPEMDNEIFYNQVGFFMEMIEQERLIIRKTLNPNHAKLYLFKIKDKHKDLFNIHSEFITGSSNLTKAGLSSQEEFNVEIRDYGFDHAEQYFDELWDTAIPITETINGKRIIVEFLKHKSQSAHITPFEAYTLILKTYIDLLKSKEHTENIERLLEENGFKKYKYQIDAVNQALNIINKNNGVIIADVVGLGKSVIASLIANQLGKRGLIISPPGLIGSKKDNTGWYGYLNDFKLYNWDIESSGNLEAVADSMYKHDKEYEVVIVDEAHRFRNQDTAAYEALMDITRGKQVILLTATPFNNSPADIFSLLKLFIIPGQSSITLEDDLEGRFNAYNYRFKRLSNILKNYNSKRQDKRRKAERDYVKLFGLPLPIDIKIVKDNVHAMAKDIKSTISPVVIRRNRLDLKTDYEYKKEIKNLSEIKDPVEQFYELSKEQSAFYDRIIQNYFSEDGQFKGAIYKPYEYETPPKDEKKLNEDENRTFVQQRNLYDFMRRLLVKRFESSFGAFDKSIERFLKTHKMVLSFIENTGKYVLDRKVIESIYNEDEDEADFTNEAIEKMLKEFEQNALNKTSPKHTKIYEIEKFHKKKEFINDIKNDIKLFEKIVEEIKALDLVKNDPKRKEVLKTVKEVIAKENNPKRKVVLFTEYADTVKHLKPYFDKGLPGRVLFCDGAITKKLAQQINENFDAKYPEQKDDFDVLVTTDKLSEGYNLNRAGLVINYDIPWNPTRVIQRVGRINRMSAKVFDELYIYNFFPTEKGSDIVKSREIAQQKMFLIHSALGEDAKIFDPDEEPTPSRLYSKLISNPEKNEELNINTLVRNKFKEIREKHPDIIQKIEELPNRTKTAKMFTENNVTVLRKKGMALFAVVHRFDEDKAKPQEKTFDELLEYVQCEYDTPRQKLNKDFWKSYEKIKEFKPVYKTVTSDLARSTQAMNSLKTLIKIKKEDLDQQTVTFINTLLEDIKKYKTLSKFTLGRLVLNKNNDYDLLLKEVKRLHQKLGSDYLKKLIDKHKHIDNDIIIAVGNYI